MIRDRHTDLLLSWTSSKINAYRRLLGPGLRVKERGILACGQVARLLHAVAGGFTVFSL